MKKYCFILLVLLSLSACDQEKKSNNLPAATGEVGEIILVMDTAQWKGPIGDSLRAVFSQAMVGLPRPENLFDLRCISPVAFNSVLKRAKNIMFVTVLNNNSIAGKRLREYFTPQSLNNVKTAPDFFIHSEKNKHAKGQEVVYLFGQTEADLLQKLQRHKTGLITHFNELERKRQIKKLKRAKTKSDFEKSLRNKHGFSFAIPYGFDLAQDEQGFVWLRRFDQEIDKSILIAYQDYVSEKVFEKENLQFLRDSIGKKHVWGSDDSLSYMKTETLIPPVFQQVDFNGNYAMEMRGLWKLNNNAMGGPFLSYVLVDEKNNRLYYIEGFIYSPGKDQKNLVREMEALLWTFKTFPQKE